MQIKNHNKQYLDLNKFINLIQFIRENSVVTSISFKNTISYNISRGANITLKVKYSNLKRYAYSLKPTCSQSTLSLFKTDILYLNDLFLISCVKCYSDNIEKILVLDSECHRLECIC